MTRFFFFNRREKGCARVTNAKKNNHKSVFFVTNVRKDPQTVILSSLVDISSLDGDIVIPSLFLFKSICVTEYTGILKSV